MPPRSPQIERLLLARQTRLFVCPACQFRAQSSIPRGARQRWRWGTRQSPNREASTVAPVSIVNAQKHIPPDARDLYEALTTLEKQADVYTNLSQLQLALRGLESENAVTRIAILGLNELRGARRLARVLLADPLAAEPPWEKHLVNADEDGRAILLRFGETLDYDQRHPLLRTLTIPASTLQTHRLEILIHSVTPSMSNAEVKDHTLLVPTLEVQDAAARYSVVRYPVHKSLVFGDGLSNLAEHSAITTARAPETKMLKGAINTRWIDTLEHESTAMVVPVNIEHAEAAITTFRQSLENSVSYEHTWFSSGLPNLSTWLLTGVDASPGSMKPTVRNLIASLLSATESRILASENEHLHSLVSNVTPASIRPELSILLTQWSERAHTELRDRLSLAFSSPGWRKLAWWKLAWRVDDVGMISSDILQRSWLTSAEKELIWLVGRVEQAGLLPHKTETPLASSVLDEVATVEVHSSATAGFIAPASENSVSLSEFGVEDDPHSVPLATKTNYPQTLSLARSALSSTTVPPLQYLAQKLVLHSLSTTVLTSSLSALVYISISTTSLYEAGTIAALGLVYSLRRLQNKWEAARGVWRESVREEGRRVLRDTETRWKEVVERGRGERRDKDDVGVEQRRVAREAVAKVREALQAQEM